MVTNENAQAKIPRIFSCTLRCISFLYCEKNCDKNIDDFCPVETGSDCPNLYLVGRAKKLHTSSSSTSSSTSSSLLSTLFFIIWCKRKYFGNCLTLHASLPVNTRFYIFLALANPGLFFAYFQSFHNSTTLGSIEDM